MEKTVPTSTVADAASTLHDLMRGAIELPVLPETTAKLLRMCNDPEIQPVTLVECVRSDAAISGHVLRLANSALFGVGTQIGSLRQAIARLGMNKLREIVLFVSCRERVFDVPGFEQDVRESFRKSFAAAIICQEIARCRRKNVEDAFLCGLLHDIGRPVLLQAVAEWQKQKRVRFDREELMAAVEQHRTEVGSDLVREWQLPERIAETVAGQACIDKSQTTDTTRLLELGCCLVEVLFGSERSLDDVQQLAIVEQLNLYPEELAEILSKSEDLLSGVE